MLRTVAAAALLLIAGCQSAESPANGRNREECAQLEPENPFSPGSGYYEGFAWAAHENPASCSGNSKSFIEGCEEYRRQRAAYKECMAQR